MNSHEKATKISWKDAVSRLAPRWIDTSTIPISSVREADDVLARYRAERKSGRKQNEKIPSRTLERLRFRLRRGLFPRATFILIAHQRYGVPAEDIAAATEIPVAIVQKAFTAKTTKRASADGLRQIRRFARFLARRWPSRIDWNSAQEVLGASIDKGTIPPYVLASRAGRWRLQHVQADTVWANPMLGYRKPCNVCGDQRSCERCQKRERTRLTLNIQNNRGRVPESALILACLLGGMDEGLACLVLAVSRTAVDKAKGKGWGSYSPEIQKRAKFLATQYEDLYRHNRFPVMAYGEAGEVRVGRMNKQMAVPRNMVVLTEIEYGRLKQWCEGRTIADSVFTVIRKKFHAANSDELSRACELFGITENHRFVGKSIDMAQVATREKK
jgi:hypothetical protein